MSRTTTIIEKFEHLIESDLVKAVKEFIVTDSGEFLEDAAIDLDNVSTYDDISDKQKVETKVESLAQYLENDDLYKGNEEEFTKEFVKQLNNKKLKFRSTIKVIKEDAEYDIAGNFIVKKSKYDSKNDNLILKGIAVDMSEV